MLGNYNMDKLKKLKQLASLDIDNQNPVDLTEGNKLDIDSVEPVDVSDSEPIPEFDRGGKYGPPNLPKRPDFFNKPPSKPYLPANWNQQIDPKSQAVEATDDIENLMLVGGLAKLGASGLPKLGKMMGLADDAIRGSVPNFAANSVGAAGKDISPLIREELAKKAMIAEPTAAEAVAKAAADKAFQPQSADAAYSLSKEAIRKQQALSRAADFAQRARLQKLIKR